MAVVARSSILMCLEDHLLIWNIGDEKWRHAVVVGILPGNAPWVLTPGRSTALVDFSADTLIDAKIWDGARLPRSTADWSVRGVFSPDELEEAIQLAAAQAVDSDAGTRVPIPQRRMNSKTTVQGAAG